MTVDTGRLYHILGAQGSGATVMIPVAGGSDVWAGVFTSQTMIKHMEKTEAVLTVQTDAARHTIPASEIDIDSISEQFGTG